MGKPMAKNLIKAGHRLVVHNRSRAAVDELVAEGGASRRGSPADVAEAATIVITMLPDTPDVEQVLTRPRRRALDASVGRRRRRHEQHLARGDASGWRTRVADKGASMLDAPVSGGEIGAINASLSIMVGGDEASFARVKPIFEAMGNAERIVHIGRSGAGQICKVCNQIAIGGALAGVSEAFALAKKAGVDAARVRQALLGGFAASRVLEVHGERMLTGNYKPGFRTKLYQKDLRLANEAASATASRCRRQRRDAAGERAGGERWRRSGLRGARDGVVRDGGRDTYAMLGMHSTVIEPRTSSSFDMSRHLADLRGQARQCLQQSRSPEQQSGRTGSPSGPKPRCVSHAPVRRRVCTCRRT